MNADNADKESMQRFNGHVNKMLIDCGVDVNAVANMQYMELM